VPASFTNFKSVAVAPSEVSIFCITNASFILVMKTHELGCQNTFFQGLFSTPSNMIRRLTSIMPSRSEDRAINKQLHLSMPRYYGRIGASILSILLAYSVETAISVGVVMSRDRYFPPPKTL
jgi:hypothetical protein